MHWHRSSTKTNQFWFTYLGDFQDQLDKFTVADPDPHGSETFIYQDPDLDLKLNDQ
jgi:hypothetical protein